MGFDVVNIFLDSPFGRNYGDYASHVPASKNFQNYFHEAFEFNLRYEKNQKVGKVDVERRAQEIKMTEKVCSCDIKDVGKLTTRYK
uniref:Uncharacterized protein n=1 Tax=Romanomermis culicivorax TaxID=13658 RepID=A0A915J5F4_ROMCU